MMIMNSEYINADTMTFYDIWPDFESFKADYDLLPTSLKSLNNEELDLAFYLLTGQYANSNISNFSLYMFKHKFFSILDEAGSVWKQKTNIRKALTSLDINDDALTLGTQQIFNTSLNPDTLPDNGAYEALNTISQQNVSSTKYNKLDGYARLLDLIPYNINERFIGSFKKLFTTFVGSQESAVYFGN